MRGQIGVEHLVIVGVTIAVLVPGIYIFYQSTTENFDYVQQSELHRGGEEIIEEAITLNQLGESSKRSVILDLPENFYNFTLEDNYTLLVNYRTGNGINNLVYVSPVKLEGPKNGEPLSSIKPGKVKLVLTNTGESICIGHPGGSCAPQCGNGIIDTADGEICDTLDFGGIDCTTPPYDYQGGNLACSSDCRSVLTDFCIGCFTSGMVCLDENVDTNPPFHSDNVIQTFGRATGPLPDIDFTGPHNTCGVVGSYKACRGGGVQLDPDALSILQNQQYSIHVEVIHPDDSTKDHQDWGIQCDGMTYFFEDDDDTQQIVNCKTDPDKFVSIFGMGSKSVDWDSVELIENCGLSPTCVSKWQDNDFVCLDQGHQDIGGNQIKSDYILPLDKNQIIQTDFDSTRVYDSVDYVIGDSYESACDSTYGIKFQGSSGPIRINLSEYNQVTIAAGQPYIFDINVIGGVEGRDDERFQIVCGSDTHVIPSPSVHDSLIYNGEAPGNKHVLIMKTFTSTCTFSDPNNAIVELTPHSGVSQSEFVEFERFRVREACS